MSLRIDIPREAIETSRNYLRRKAILSAADVVCDSNSGVRLFSRAWPAPTVGAGHARERRGPCPRKHPLGAGHARDTLAYLKIEFSRLMPNVREASAVGQIGAKRCHSPKK